MNTQMKAIHEAQNISELIIKLDWEREWFVKTKNFNLTYSQKKMDSLDFQLVSYGC